MARNRPKVCIDRVLPGEEMRRQGTEVIRGAERAIAVASKLWMNGTTLHVRFMGGTATQQAKAREQGQWWTQHANLQIVFDDAPGAQIRVAFDSTDGAWSYVGTDCMSIPRDQPTMNLGFFDGGTVAHEFGHAIGLAHEHQNPRGGIEWNEAKVIKDLSGPPNFWDEPQIRHNVLRKYSLDQIRGTAFDPDSIMLYFFPASWTLNGIATKANSVLSGVDKSFIGSDQAYPPAKPPATAAKKLTVNAPRRTSASIGMAGEEDLYTFTVAKGGPHVVDTRGGTDLVMRLFGPDSETALVKEDDDSGVGLNPRIAADLVPGTYFVQVRHYRKATGTGSYTIKATTPG
jgi:hypothetical protein